MVARQHLVTTHDTPGLAGDDISGLVAFISVSNLQGDKFCAGREGGVCDPSHLFGAINLVHFVVVCCGPFGGIWVLGCLAAREWRRGGTCNK